ncbi:NAD(P)/FAD-dependent oxidoreductase [Candidatus Merdisoma sp. HCP28S3_D10]|uniref:NAD(P)/FAD-dependent oxidoreductase n=1 Tax=unclassified Candidatus Merdisoma TaxID=3099611 RepID=UPI003F8CF1F4
MIRISQIKLPTGHDGLALVQAAARELKVSSDKIEQLTIQKKSVDARKKPISYVYTVDVKLKGEEKLLKKLHNRNVTAAVKKAYHFPEPGREKLPHRPVIVGTGPAGLFCGLMLARAGYRPILLERGETARKRKETVDRFWGGGALKLHSNVQFGEGGAGTFSDGKLNTLVKDPEGRGRLVLQTFVQAGAPEEILYWNKPHLGTDVLIGMVEHIRKEIEDLGGQVYFDTQLVDIEIRDGQVCGVYTRKSGEQEGEPSYLETEVLVLAIGHSARDTFAMLRDRKIPMERKAFAVGVRIEHPQELINVSQYGEHYPDELPTAAYKVTRKVGGDRGVYSFCMCPGGYVVNASSEEGGLAVNGMSYQARDGRNANSAMIVTVRPEDFGGEDLLSGVEFQRKLERAAFAAGGGKVPVQLLGDFCRGQLSTGLGGVEPCIKGAWEFGDVRGIFPEYLSAALEEGILDCEHLISGFSRADAVLSGVESRTSSPVRILRGDRAESPVKGLYPCGEGAGYAGGITSAAMDGVRTAEMIAGKYSRNPATS